MRMPMLELVADSSAFAATRDGRRKHHVLTGVVGAPEVNDPARVIELRNGEPTGAMAFARITFVETIESARGPAHVLSLDVRMSTDRMPAIRPEKEQG